MNYKKLQVKKVTNGKYSEVIITGERNGKRFRRNYMLTGSGDIFSMEITNKHGAWLYEVGLMLEKNSLVDYDGVYSIDPADIKAIRAFGIRVPRDFED